MLDSTTGSSSSVATMTKQWKVDDINFEEIDEDLASFQEDEIVQSALHRGVDLRKYGKELERDLRQVGNGGCLSYHTLISDLKCGNCGQAEMESVSQYVENSEQVIDLHRKMQECDGVLARMEEMLHGFQADLGEISSEIKHLQDDSLSMSIRLKNRRASEAMLNVFLEKSTILPFVATAIVSVNISDEFLHAVVMLSHRLKYLEQTEPPTDGSSLDIAPSETFCGRSMLPELEKLKIKAVSKIRDYFSLQFGAIRKPKTNIQMVQQNALLKYSPLFHFLEKEAFVAADDLRSIYVESMGRTLMNLFKNYSAQLAKLDCVMATKSDLIAVEEATLKSLFTQKVGIAV
jgi:hypothetical protein